MTIQDVTNKLQGYEETRRRNREAVYDRMIHNQDLQTLIRELTSEE